MLDKKKVTEVLLNHDRRGNHPDGVYSVTDVTGCIRRTFFSKLLGSASKNNGAMLIGKKLHELVPHLVPAGSEIEKELEKHVDSVRFVGHADAANGDWIYEFKFVTDEKNLPVGYFDQANAYAVMSGKANWQVIAVNKFTLNAETYEGKASREQYDRLVENLRILHESTRTLKPPDGPPAAIYCRWCEWKSRCYHSDNESYPKDRVLIEQEVKKDVQKKEESAQ